MPKESRDYLEMTFHSIHCFSNDGKLMVSELEKLLRIALKDGVVDENEKRILKNIFSRLTPSELTDDMLEKIKSIRKEYNF